MKSGSTRQVQGWKVGQARTACPGPREVGPRGGIQHREARQAGTVGPGTAEIYS